LIGRLVIQEADGNAEFPDANIGFDSFRFMIPEPGSIALFGVGIMLLLARRTVRARIA
jgi:hypothetical protein